MPSFTFTSPEGKNYTVNGPDGATKEQAFQMLQQQLGQSSAPAAPPVDDRSLWEKARPYVAPAVEAVGMVGGGILGGAAGAVASPTIVANPVTGAMAGSGLGYAGAKQLMELGDTYLGGKAPQKSLGQTAADTVKDVATGAAYEVGGRLVVPIAKWVIPPAIRNAAGKGVGWVVDKTSGQIHEINAGKILRSIAGDKETDIRLALQNARPGTTNTAGQIVADAGVAAPEFQAMQRRAATEMPTQYGDIAAQQEGARTASLQAVTPDLATAKAARTAASKPLYQQADASVVAPLTTAKDSSGVALLERPSLRSAVASAENVAADKGVAMYDGAGNLTGQGAHLIKVELDDAASGITRTTAAKGAVEGINKTKDEYLTWLKNNGLAAYDKGRAAFAQMSVPVNQSNILTDLQGVLRNPVTGGERVGPFANAMTTGTERVVKRSGVSIGGKIEDHLSVPQMDAANTVLNQLRRDATMSSQATAGANSLNRILGESSQAVQLPPTLTRTGAVLNKVLSVMSGRVNERTLRMLSEAMQSSRPTLELLNTVPSNQRQALLRALQSTTDATATGRVAGVATNALTQDR